MRPIPMLTLAAVLALASAAAAQPAQAPTPEPAAAAPADQIDLPPLAEDRAQAEAMATQLSEFDARIRADELRMTTLRNAALAKTNVRLKAIKPALPLHGTTWIQLFP